MATRPRLAGALGRALLATVMAGVVTALAACGSVAAGPAGQPGPAPPASSAVAVSLCADRAHLVRMVVSLGAGFMPGPVQAAQPVGVTVSDPARVRAVAAALCGLPVMPSAHLACPAIRGGAYRLTFFAAGRMFPPVMVETAGCRRLVSGLGPARQASGSFLGLLRRELGPGHGVPAPGPPAA